MDAAPESTELVELSAEELAVVIGGASLRGFNAQDFVYNKIGMCGCGLTH